MTEQAEAGTHPEGSQRFALQRVYIKDLSFESPDAPQVFQHEWKPEMNLELNNQSTQIETHLFEVVLSLTVKVKNKNTVAFLVELQQAGLFHAEGFDQKTLAHLLGAYCPNILFPFAREAVSDLVGKASFPQLLLAPVNFDALFAEAAKRRQAELESQASIGGPDSAHRITH